MRPPTGYYRQLLPSNLSHIRIARTDQPMSGVQREECGEQLAAHFDTLGNDPWAAWYAAELRSGRLVAISVPEATGGRNWRPGELFLRS